MNRVVEKAVLHFKKSGYETFVSTKNNSNNIVIKDNNSIKTVKCFHSSPHKLANSGKTKSYEVRLSGCDVTFADCGDESYVIDNKIALSKNKKAIRFGLDSRKNSRLVKKVQ